MAGPSTDGAGIGCGRGVTRTHTGIHEGIHLLPWECIIQVGRRQMLINTRTIEDRIADADKDWVETRNSPIHWAHTNMGED